MIKWFFEKLGYSLTKLDREQNREAGFKCPTTGDPMYYDKYDCVICGAPGYECKKSIRKIGTVDEFDSL